MSIRSIALALSAVGFAVGCVAAEAAPDPSATEGTATSEILGGFTCVNGVSVLCTGDILVPITVNIKDIDALNDNQLAVLSDDLNHLSILDGGILNQDKILNDVEVTVLKDFLNKFNIDITKNDVDVCANVLGALLCK